MKDIFQTETINELANRISQLNENSKAKWGKMNLFEMLKHCTENEKMMLKQIQLKRRFIGKLFGKTVLKSIVKNEDDLKKNTPTHQDLKFKGSGDIEKYKSYWIQELKKYPQKSIQDYKEFIHPFFGKMDREQVSIFAYKHVDHHLRQFGV